MGERRSDRSGKRQRSSRGVNKSSSDTELAQGKCKEQKNKSKEKWPLLEYALTVDELSRYRRRRVQGQPRDNLGLNPEAEHGDHHVSEYREAFRARSEEYLKENTWREASERTEDLQSKDTIEIAEISDREEFQEIENEQIEIPKKDKEAETPVAEIDEQETMETETANSKLTNHSHPARRSLIKRGTTLKYDGKFYADTETYSSYVAYEGQHRPELARRPTSLKMEGDLHTTSEQCEKFIQWLNVSRPELMRVPTHLKLKGEMNTTTESHEKYVPFVGVRRPELLRQNTNLKLEGESNFVPEYTDVFKRYNSEGRPQPVKHSNNLETGNSFFQSTENTDNFSESRARDKQPTNESKKNVEDEENGRKEFKEQQRKDEEMKMLVSKLEDLKGPPLEIPEYKDAYKDFPRERPKTVKPEDEIGRADGSKVSSSPTPKFSTRIDQDPEYKSKYLDYRRDYPVYRKLPLIVRSSLNSSEHGMRFGRQDLKQHDYEFTSEVKSQYVPYGHIPRVETLKMPTHLRLEGNLALEPEYRMAYCTKRENHLHTEPRMHRRRDRSLSASRRNENYWINSNAEHCDYISTAQDQDAFQVFKSRVHEDTMSTKPPAGGRRGPKTSQQQVQRQTQLDTTESNILKKDTSFGPTYRLQVCNVDDESRGFRNRRTPSLQSSGRMRNPSLDRTFQSDAVRPYSPSFGKNTKQQNNGQSFVVLDNGIFDANKNDIRRKRADRNYNIDGAPSISKGKNKTSTNWMPPWYDSINTI